MQCPKCGGGFELAGGGQYARCMRCLSLYQQGPQGPTPIQVSPPGGGQNQEFENSFAQNLGFGPPQPGAGRHNIPDMRVGDMNVKVKINGMSVENYAKDRVSSMIWGWIIGGIILAVIVIGGAIFGIYLYISVKSDSTAGANGVPNKTAEAAAWDGKSTFECGGNDAVKLKGVTANVSDVGVNAGGNCQLTLENCNITAPTGITAGGNAKITITGGSITSKTNAIDANGLAQVTVSGTKVSGKVAKMGLAKVTGAQ